ncbi:MAG: MBL fold metallo-hydrolase [Deltaproteobacteria bacterium]|nr:MBL fold metallo-hydrolase [Deltaproteobacteria bacterium]
MWVDNGMQLDGRTMDGLARRLEGRRRILFWGDMGVGKSTLALQAGQSFVRRFGYCQVLSLDPGSPPFGVPGSVSRSWWADNVLKWGDCQALCTLNAARFRLPLVLAARRVMAAAEAVHQDGPILIDPPGVVRGTGGAELLTALVESLGIDAVVVLCRRKKPLTLSEELASMSPKVMYIPASSQAKRPSRQQRANHRTTLWDRFLENGAEQTFMLDGLRLLGTPSPCETPEAWPERQAALLSSTGDTLCMGEVIRLTGRQVTLRVAPGLATAPVSLLIRDAGRNPEGKLETRPQVDKKVFRRREPQEMTPPGVVPGPGTKPLSSHVGPAWATLVGGVLGDPLLHVRLRNHKKSLFFDLGDPGRLAAKVVHQVDAVFLSHAHIDHIGGFLWLLRSRIGTVTPCKVFGPAETIARIAHFLGAITWDRIEENGPVFEVCEFDGVRLKRARLQPGKHKLELPSVPIKEGIILQEATFRIIAVVCDHNIPSIAYGLVFDRDINIRKERLRSCGWVPGPWLGRLKACIAAGTLDVGIQLPDGAVKSAADLAETLTIVRPGKKLIYAADVADTRQNRDKLIALARSAHTFFCETAFAGADKQKADTTQHLTTLAATAIARSARVERLVPFHFSRRYEHNLEAIYNEIRKQAGPVKILGHFH